MSGAQGDGARAPGDPPLDEAAVLEEASRVLQAPVRGTRRKILAAINVAFAAAVTLHVVTQLATFGRLPNPSRDAVIYPAWIGTMVISAFYNILVLTGRARRRAALDRATAYGSIVLLQLVSISIVHQNPNTATSLLLDASLSLLLIFITGLVLDRWAAAAWAVMAFGSILVAASRLGWTFEYHLLTRAEAARYEELLARADPAAVARSRDVAAAHLAPLPVGLFVAVWAVFILLAALSTFIEAGMVDRLIGVIPGVIGQIRVASERQRALARENARMGMELDVARHIQTMVLPRRCELDACRGLRVAARMETANEVGGDFYDVLPQADGATYIGIGDVTDHGLPSGVVMLMTQSALRAAIDDRPPPPLPAVLGQINTVLYRNIHGRLADTRNLTLALLRFEDGRVTICGQHESVIVHRRRTGAIEVIDTIDLGLYVGMIEDVAPHVAERTLDLDDGDLLFLYTDGVVEAEGRGGALYGRDRLLSALRRAADEPVGAIVDAVLSDVRAFIGDRTLDDDITLVAVRRCLGHEGNGDGR